MHTRNSHQELTPVCAQPGRGRSLQPDPAPRVQRLPGTCESWGCASMQGQRPPEPAKKASLHIWPSGRWAGRMGLWYRRLHHSSGTWCQPCAMSSHLKETPWGRSGALAWWSECMADPALRLQPPGLGRARTRAAGRNTAASCWTLKQSDPDQGASGLTPAQAAAGHTHTGTGHVHSARCQGFPHRVGQEAAGQSSPQP